MASGPVAKGVDEAEGGGDVGGFSGRRWWLLGEVVKAEVLDVFKRVAELMKT